MPEKQDKPVRQEIIRFIAEFLKQPPEKVIPEKELTALVHESFVLIQLVVELQDRFKARLTQEDLKAVKTVGDLIAAVLQAGNKT